MAIFRDLSKKNKQSSDRSLADRKRNKELVRDIIRDVLPNIIIEESIIGVSGNKKIKVPIRSIPEWRFVFGRGEGVGQGQDGGDQDGDGYGNKSGDNTGEMVLEVTLDLDEVIDIIFEDLEIPFLEQKKFREFDKESYSKWQGSRRHGIQPRFNYRASYVEKLKRKKAMLGQARRLKDTDPEQARKLLEQAKRMPFPYDENDLRYYTVTQQKDKESNAVIFAVMDVSGSMDKTKRYLAKMFLFILYLFIHKKYKRADIVYVAHHTEAFETNEHDFFHLGESGGTHISSGILKVLEIVETRYPRDLWNIYVTHCSDGDNYEKDNERAHEAMKKLLTVANLVGFIEINPPTSGPNLFSFGQGISSLISDPHFQYLVVNEKKDLWPKFRDFINCDKAVRQ